MHTPSASPVTQSASSANNHSAAVDLFSNHSTTPAPVTNRSIPHTHYSHSCRLYSTLESVLESVTLSYGTVLSTNEHKGRIDISHHLSDLCLIHHIIMSLRLVSLALPLTHSVPNLTSDLFDLQPAFIPAVQSTPSISTSSSAWGGKYFLFLNFFLFFLFF